MTISPVRIYLASASPRRRELLAQIGVEFDTLITDIDETPLQSELPRAYVERLAREKAAAGIALMRRREMPVRPLLAADTTVVLGNDIIGKPLDDGDALAILRRLAGTTHQVMTAIALADGERIETRISISDVRFRAATDQELLAYIATGEPKDKAGAYGIQGHGAVFVEELRGSYTGVMGLPLFETADLLKAFNLSIWSV